MPNRAQDWLKQAERDLKHAENSVKSQEHEWACFAAHQCAEKALKALHLYFGQEVWGHSVTKILNELSEIVEVPEDLVEKAKVLDSFYISPRYPDSYPEGAPFEYFGPLQSEVAIQYAKQILEFVRSQMAKKE